MTNGVDYAWGRPGGASLAAAGVQFAMRYASLDPSKNLTRDEALDLAAHGVAVGVVWETTTSRALGGYGAGATDAAAALAQANAAGAPSGSAVYAAVDFDVQDDQLVVLDEYFRGWNTVLAPDRTGVYGGYRAVEHIVGNGRARYGWQTTAWSGGAWSSHASIRQDGGSVQLGGVDCDRNVGMVDDIGTWHPAGSTPAPAPGRHGTVTVQSGDTLSGIAERAGVSLGALEAANPQIHDFNLIHPGDVINLPGGSNTPAPAPAPHGTVTVQSGDTLSGIAERAGVSLGSLEAANPQIHDFNLIHPGDVINLPGGGSTPAPAPQRRTVTVQDGDTLSGIAEQAGMSLGALEAANPQIHDFNLIHPGDVINLS